jgi:hypothetical protein
MLRTLAVVATAAAFGIGLATTVAAAPPMKGGGNFHANMAAPSANMTAPNVGAGPAPNTGGMIHGNAASPNTAFAPKSFNGNWNQSWNGNWRDHDRFRHHHRGFVGFGLYAYGPDYYDYDYSCYQRRFVPTPHGWRWRLIWVCGPNY